MELRETETAETIGRSNVTAMILVGMYMERPSSSSSIETLVFTYSQTSNPNIQSTIAEDALLSVIPRSVASEAKLEMEHCGLSIQAFSSLKQIRIAKSIDEHTCLI